MNSSLVLLDVNIPMYAAGREHIYHEPCIWIMREIAAGNLPAAIDVEIIQEILYRYTYLGQVINGIKISRDVLDIIPVVFAVFPNDIEVTMRLLEEYGTGGVNPRDLIHAAVMLNNGLTQVISTDRHFDRIQGIQRLDPLDLFKTR